MKKIFPTALFLALLVACSSGGGSDNGGIGGTGFSQGVVTDISNSARVTGTLWETDANTTFLPTGEASEADLQVGRVVQIEGSTGATNLATRVRIDDIIRGPVSAPQDIEPPEAGLREFEILGMRVVMSLDTTIYVGFPDPGAPDVAGFDNLVLNQNVSVSGFQGPNGIIATRIELEGTGGAVKFRGTASDLAADVFDIGDVEVNFDVVTTEFVDFGPGGIMEGDFVEVEGTLGGAPFDPPFVVAADLGRIRLREQGIEDQGDLSDVEIEGIVTNFVNLGSFRVAGQLVSTFIQGVQFEPTNTSFVRNGARIEVEGNIRGGVLLANAVKFRQEEARVEAELPDPAVVDPVAGTFELAGVSFSTDSATKFEGDDFAGLADLESCGFVKVRGILVSAGVVRATLVKCESGGDSVLLRGRVEGFDAVAGTFDLLGIEIDTGAAGFSGFSGVTTEAQFYLFLSANPGVLVETDDMESDGDKSTFGVADEVEREEPAGD